MPEISVIKNGRALLPYTPEDDEAIKTIKNGEVLTIKYSVQRNLQFHRKFFALINLAFDYDKPNFSLVSAAERAGIINFAKHMAKLGEVSDEPILALADEYISSTEKRRLQRFGEPLPCKIEFRKNVIIEAGYFDLKSTPTGVIKVAKSMKFKSMDNQQFAELYKAVFNVLWVRVLNRIYSSHDDAEAAVNQAVGQLMSFA